MNMETNENINGNSTPAVAGRDTKMDVSSLLKAAKNDTSSNENKKSPLELAKEAKENGGLGVVVDNNELINGSKEEPLITNKAEYDAMSEIDEYMAEQDRMINAAKQMTFDEKPKTVQEVVAVMSSIEDAANSGKIPTNQIEIPKQSDQIEINENQNITQEDDKTDKNDTVNENEEKRNIVNILIDKTGFGGELNFTEEEQEKISLSTEIRLKEIEEVDLSTIKVKKSEKSFVESVNEYQVSSSMTPVVFPASRFRANMCGLSFGEMGDISLNAENTTFEQMRKRFTVIYNKMSNASIGKFESFDDFLKKFAYVDLDLAVYGMIVASFPEIDEISLTCQHPDCKRSFVHKYSPRTLLRLDKADDVFLKAMQDVIDCDADKFNELVEQSPVRTHKRIKLPYSNFIIEFGIASAYEYLYSILDNIIGDKFNENHPDDVNDLLKMNSTLLTLIRAVYVPDSSGEYILFDEFEDMINALYMIKPEDIMVLSTILQKYADSYNVLFELTDVRCPHCGTISKSVEMDINYLVFLRYQRLMSTSIDISSIGML